MSEEVGTALITGGTRGLGRALTLWAARKGWSVVAIYASDEEAAQNLLQAGSGLPGQIQCVRHDASKPGFPALAGDRRMVFIHSASAPFQPSPLHLLDPAEFQRQWEIAVLGFVHGLHAVLRPMVRNGGGTVVGVLTSALDGMPPKGFGAYSSAKQALWGLSRSLGCEYRDKGVRSFCVSPGFMQTDFSDGWDSRLRAAVADAQAGGAHDPEKVAEEIWGLVLDPSVPAMGENYPVGNPGGQGLLR
jgi:NAD(P)-dependent dehydrogenase (short-subunit alcohol dehydrogenase family)